MKQFQAKHAKLEGEISAPSSKSHTLRAILFASLARGRSTIINYLQSPDAEAMIKACRLLGAKIVAQPNRLNIEGVAGQPKLADNVIDAGNSGQVLRFVAAVAALGSGYTVLTGDDSVRHNRPIQPLIDGLKGLGAECVSTKNDGHAPLIVKGPIEPGVTQLDGQDSQPVSAMLIASAFLNGQTEIVADHPGETPWIGVTLDWFHHLGIPYTNSDHHHYIVEGVQTIEGFHYTVPGDFSSIAYPLVAAIITDSPIVIHNIDPEDPQGDKALIDTLQAMGAQLVLEKDRLIVHPGHNLQGMTIDVNAFIDALPILAVVGCYAQGTTRLVNAGIARRKESDRLAAMTCELKKMGAMIEAYDDSLVIHGGPLKPATVDSWRDHRIAMSMTVAAMGLEAPSTVLNTHCVDKSYCYFTSDLKELGAAIEVTP